jgi:hypothetical protein
MSKKRLLSYSICIIVIVSFLRITSITMDKSNETLQLKITADQNSYQVGDIINVILELENISEQSVVVNSRMAMGSAPYGEIEFIFTQTPGVDVYRWVKIRIGLPNDTSFVTLKPGDTISTTHQLSRYYGPLSEPGQYSFRAIYVNCVNPSSGDAAWQGEIESNTLSIRIMP